jgi:hypothetical protein
MQVMAGLGYGQKSAIVLFSLLTVLGGGLPGRPGLKKSRALVICDNIFCVSQDGRGVNLESEVGIQFVEIVKLTVIFACVSTGSAPM